MVVNPRMTAWTHVSGKAPAGPSGSSVLERSGHSATAVGTDVYVIGGKTKGNQFCKDICKLDTAAGKWRTGFLRPPFGDMAYHSATLMGTEIWIVGGSDDKHTSSHVYVLNTGTLQWRTVSIRGDTRLLQRTAHGCVRHPKLPNTLLLFGGWGINCHSHSDGGYAWLNDLAILKLDSLTVERVQPKGTPPTARAYHSFNAIGHKCYVVGGRTSGDNLLVGDQLLCVYEVATNQWVSPGAVSGSLNPRSSHKGVVVGGNQLVICGGAGTRKLRMDDTYVLKQCSKGQLSWRRLAVTPFQTDASCQAGRGGHTMTKCNGSLYILAGYGVNKVFPSDVWSLPLDAVTGATANKRSVQPQNLDIALEDQPARCEATCWRSAKRSRPEGSKDTGHANKRQHALAPAGPVATAQPLDSHPCQAVKQPLQQVAPALPRLPGHTEAVLPQPIAADRHASSMLPPAMTALYGGCAFNDAAAISATVSRLEGNLARAKAALNERLALEEGHLRQRRDLETDIARLRCEVTAAEQRCSTSTQQSAHFQRLSEERLQRLQAAETATADANSRAAAAVATAGELQQQLSVTARQRDEFSRLITEGEEASKAAEADAVKARGALRQERIDWEKADAESRTALHSLKEEWRMLQHTNTQLHATVTRLTKSLEGAEQKVSEGVSALAEMRRKAGEEREQSSKALQAQQAATQTAEQHLQAAQARIGAAEAANKRSEAELIQLRPHATRLQEDLSQSQAKLKTAQADVASLRAEAAHNKEVYDESTKALEQEGQHLADNANAMLKIIAQRRTHSPALASG